MSVHIHNKRRSIKSALLEKFLLFQKSKDSFSSIEKTTQFVKQAGMENNKPYTIGNIHLASELKEDVWEGIQIFTLNDQNSSTQKVIFYIHGGAWTIQPLVFHWKFMDKMAQSLNAKIIAPIYPKVPHFHYNHTYPSLLSLYKKILSTIESPEQLTIMGDSSGGNISLGLAHLLKMNDIPQPKDIILLSACVDMVLDNPLIPEYEKNDPMLAVGGMEVITKKWANDKNLNDPIISPIYGDFEGKGKITHFIGTHEGLYPDAIRLDEKLTKQGIEINTFVYPKMNHVFVIMPIPEAKDAQEKIVGIINGAPNGVPA